MIIIHKPKRLRGEVFIPGDKSISHRALILASLAEGVSTIENLSPSADVQSTCKVLQKLGSEIFSNEKSHEVTLRGKGRCGLRESPVPLFCGNSGTTARLLMGVLAGQRFFSVLTGDQSLQRRPMQRVIVPMQQMGAQILARQQNTLLPIAIQGAHLRGIRYELPIASAQVKTALLLAGLLAEGETTVVEPLQSRDHTERLFQWLGLPLQKVNLQYSIESTPIPSFRLSVPGDFSSAAYFVALAAIHPDAELTLRNVNINPTRIGFLEVLQRMGLKYEIQVEKQSPEPVGTLMVRSSQLRNVAVSAAEVPKLIDELPLLAVVATQAEGKLIVHGAQELRVKESDRIRSIVTELTRMGAQLSELTDGFVVEGPTPLHGAFLRTHGDHRIAMALAVAAAVAHSPSQLTGERWVTISYPDFFNALFSLYEV
ncbi:3-phosphoshikimate 1-carboxyvinyltransferase [bacterium]|nr:3-phosphoshikimate 1-carboxyvinyltransferase [bacterium]